MTKQVDILESIPWKGTAIALLDLDAFYASVEQRDNPEWRGKPVIVGGHSDKRGVVAAASYEARAYGVHSAMPAAEAERRCPHAIWTPGDHDHYKEVSAQVMSLITNETPYIQQVSIDEAFFDITPGRHTGDHPVKIVRRIQDAVREMGITCSIGLSTSKSVAKIAADVDKPDGLTVIFPGSEADFLNERDIKELSGIGPKAQSILRAANIHTLGDFAQTTEEQAAHLLGSVGPMLRLRAQGKEDSPIVIDEPIKSVSNERTFAKDLTTQEELNSSILFLGEKVVRRLRSHNLKAYTLTLKIRFDWENTRTAQTQVPGGFDDIETIKPVLFELLDKLWTAPTPVRLIGVGASKFDGPAEQLDLFNHAEENEADTSPKRPRTAEALDSIRDKFGENTLMYGSEFLTRERLGTTISSTHQHAPKRNSQKKEESEQE